MLTDGTRELGTGVLNSDRRGAAYQQLLRGRYRLTGHWPAPELTLPKLLHVQQHEPARWASATRVLFVHDWLLWRLTGREVTGVDYACAGGMADVARRGWASDMLADVGVPPERLAPVVEAGTPVGGLTAAGFDLPAGTPVHAGPGDTQLAALGAGGLADGTVTVVAGSSTPVQAAAGAPPMDPLEHPWVSTHAAPNRWAVETNAGYPGTMAGWWRRLAGVEPSGRPGAGGLSAVTGAPEWSERAWSIKAPVSLLGLRPDTEPADIAQALAEAHAYAVRGNVADLERVLGRPVESVVVTGGAAAPLAPLLAAVLGRPVRLDRGGLAAGRGGVALVTGRPVGADLAVVPAGDPAPYAAPYQRYLRAWSGLREQLAEPDR